MDSMSASLKELASAVSRRGITIHGREKIVELCAKSGVTLLEGLFGADLAEDSQDDLMDFLVRYSRLTPASKLTVLVLAKQYGVTPPPELLKKKVGLADFLRSLPDFLT